MINKVSRGTTKWTPEMEAELVNLRNGGMHPQDIAKHFGLSVATVEARFYKLKRMMR